MNVGDSILYSDGRYGEVMAYDYPYVLLRFSNGSQFALRLGWDEEEAERRRAKREKNELVNQHRVTENGQLLLF